MKKNYIAFTMAEVLITLGLIGVVAAMTFPRLMGHYQKKTTAVKVQKFYTIFNQAMMLAKVENGEYKDWIYTDTEFLCRNFLIKHFKTINIQTNVQISGSFTDGVAVTLEDGSQFVCTKRINGSWEGDKLSCVYLAKKKKKKDDFWDYGKIKGSRNIFWFVVNENTGMLEPPYLDRENDYLKQRCTSENPGGNAYFTCSTLLYKNGWEFPKDYPW